MSNKVDTTNTKPEKKRQLMPKLRFPEFRDAPGWEEKRLEQISDIRTGPFGSVLHQSDYVEIGTPIITVEHLGELGITGDNFPRVSDSDRRRLSSYQLKEGDIVFSRVGSVDRSSIVRIREAGWLFSGRLLRIRIRNLKENSPQFLNQLFECEFSKAKIRNMAVGQTMPSLNTEILNSISFHLPSSLEQKKIADCFSSIDELIAAQSQKLDTLKAHKKGLLQQLFPAEGETLPQLRFPEFHDEPEWEEKPLGQIATFTRGKGISKSDIFAGGSQPCIRYGELYTHYKETIHSVVSYTDIQPDDLVLSRANDVIIPASGETQIDIATASCVVKSGIALGSDLNIIRSNVNGVFLAYYLNNAKKKAIADIAQGISVVHLYSSQLKTLKMNIPSIAEQQRIADCLSSVDELIDEQTERIDALNAHKKGLMQQLFPSPDEVYG